MVAGDTAQAEERGRQWAEALVPLRRSEAEVGKRVGKDADAGKATFNSLLGGNATRAEAMRIVERAQDSGDLVVTKAVGQCGSPFRVVL